LVYKYLGILFFLISTKTYSNDLGESFLKKICDNLFVLGAIDYNLPEYDYKLDIIRYKIILDSLSINFKISKPENNDLDSTSVFKVYSGIKCENGLFKKDKLLLFGNETKYLNIKIEINESLIFEFNNYYSFFGKTEFYHYKIFKKYKLKKFGHYELKNRLEKKYCK
jgi:hypothetical protein